MKVILLQELKGKGGEGDVVDVAPGFANNYLMPQGIAILATKGNLKQLEMRKNNIAKREATRLADAEKLKSVLDGASVKVDAKVGEEGQLFGSVTATQIAEAIKEALGVRSTAVASRLARPSRPGQHEVVISIYRDIAVTLRRRGCCWPRPRLSPSRGRCSRQQIPIRGFYMWAISESSSG